MPFRDGLNFIMPIFRVRTCFNPLRVFLPISFVLSLIALLMCAHLFLLLGKVMDVTVIVLIVAAIQIGAFGLLAELVVRRTRYR